MSRLGQTVKIRGGGIMGAGIYLLTDQVVAHPNWGDVQVLLDTPYWDNGGYWSAANHGLLIPADLGGAYLVAGGYVSGGANAGQYKWLAGVTKNGTSIMSNAVGYFQQKVPYETDAFDVHTFVPPFVVNLLAGDILRLVANMPHSDPSTIYSPFKPAGTYLWAVRL